MCELFAYNGADENIINDYLELFYARSDEHPHGWGLAILDGKEAAIEKEPASAKKSAYLKARLTQPVFGKCVFAHIRYATIGNVEYANCHPYTAKDNSGRRWTLIHNGTIFDYSPLNSYIKKQKGETDSERILLYITDQINEAEREGKLSGKERFEILNKIISDMSKGNKLNLVIYDGRYTYVHTNYKDSLYYLKKDKEVIISTAPLTNEEWENVPFTRLLAFSQGNLVFEGDNHNNEYIDSEENMKLIYQIFSGL